MKYDYTKQFQMMQNIPNLNPTFQNLMAITTPVK